MPNKSRPLYESTRQEIWSKIHREKYESKRLDIELALQSNALEFYNDMYPQYARDLMNDLPHNAFKHSVSFYLILGPQKIILHMLTPRPFFYIDPKKSYGSTHPLTEARMQLLETQTDYNAEVNLSRQKVMSLLNSVNTTKQLMEAWPEIIPYIPPGKKVVKTYLPAIPVKQVNELLGLK